MSDIPKQNDFERLAAAVEKLAEAVEGLGCRISEDEPLSFAIARGLERLAEAIETNRME